MQFESETHVHAGDDAEVESSPVEAGAVESVVTEDASAEADGEQPTEAQDVAVDEALEVVADAADEVASDDSGPSVDELEDRLRDLQGAMDKIQSGDLDAAERAIESLEQRMETTRD